MVLDTSNNSAIKLDLNYIINGFMSRENIQSKRQALSTIITMDRVVLKPKKDYETVYLYNPKSKELEENNLKDLIDSYIFPAIANKQDVKAIGGYFKEVNSGDIWLYNKVIRGKTNISNNQVKHAFKTISNTIYDLEYKRDALRTAHIVKGYDLIRVRDSGIEEVA